MKIAIFHNYMDNIGGAEIVVLTLARELGADIYTTNFDLEKIRKMGFTDIKIKSIGKIPINAPFRQQAALRKFKKLNLKNKYDIYIIAGDWAISGAVNNKPNLVYVHSPLREIWDLYPKVRKQLRYWFKQIPFDLWTIYNRHLNRKYFNHASHITCNSENTRKRIEKYLNKKAIVINPPTETSKFKFKKNENYWLSVNRLFIHKRIDMQTNAFSKLPNENLIIVGSYEKSKHFQEYAAYINKIKPKNVKILSWIDLEELTELYSNCKGFITTAQDEDFGMTPVEAMASGKPIIAANEGGYKETIIDNKTGTLIDEINSEKLINAIKKISKELKKNPNTYKKACINQAKKFDTKIFINKIKKQIEIIQKKTDNKIDKKNQKVLVVIPARLMAKRLPRKILLDLNGKPLIQHVYEGASKSKLADKLIIATDSEEIKKCVESFGAEAIITSNKHKTGSDRVAETAKRFPEYNIVINVQGDNPFVTGEMIDSLIKTLIKNPKVPMVALKSKLNNKQDIENPDISKVVTDKNNLALYYTRLPAPYNKHIKKLDINYYRNKGVYGFQRNFLLHYVKLPQGPLEKAESLEQLRALEHGFKICVIENNTETCEINVPEDIAIVKKKLKERDKLNNLKKNDKKN